MIFQCKPWLWVPCWFGGGRAFAIVLMTSCVHFLRYLDLSGKHFLVLLLVSIPERELFKKDNFLCMSLSKSSRGCSLVAAKR